MLVLFISYIDHEVVKPLSVPYVRDNYRDAGIEESEGRPYDGEAVELFRKR
jgi:hypothetical protein